MDAISASGANHAEEQIHFGPYHETVANWIGAHPTFWAILAVVAMAAILWRIFTQQKNDRIFIVMSIATIFIFRFLTFYLDELNVDEAFLLTDALGFLADPRIWVAVDGTTLGPATYLPLALPAGILQLFGVSGAITFLLARVVTTVLIIGTFLPLYSLLKEKSPLKLAQLLMLFFTAFTALNNFFDLQAYNREYVFCFFFVWALWFLFRFKTTARNVHLAAAGVFSGILPYTNLQAIPLMTAHLLWMGYVIFRATPASVAIDKKMIFRQIMLLCAATLVPTILLIAYCATYADGLRNAYFYYVENNFAHIHLPLFSWLIVERSVATLRLFFAASNEIGGLFILPLFAATFFLGLRFSAPWQRDRPRDKFSTNQFAMTILVGKPKFTADWCFAGLIVAAALFAIFRTGQAFTHYALFLLVPALFFLAVSWECGGVEGNPSAREKRYAIIFGFYCLWVFHSLPTNIYNLAKSASRRRVGNNAVVCALAEFIVHNTARDDAIVMWGWAQKYHVYTNRHSATAQSNIERLWGNYPPRNVALYLQGIRHNRPKFIIDVVAPGSFGFDNTELYALEKHSEIWANIKDDYQLYGAIPVNSGERSGEYRIYARRTE